MLLSDLSWSQHINDICNKTKNSLALSIVIFTNSLNPQSLFQMYISTVHPNMEYVSQVWSPYKIGEVNSIECVHKFALHIHACQNFRYYLPRAVADVLPTRSSETYRHYLDGHHVINALFIVLNL